MDEGNQEDAEDDQEDEDEEAEEEPMEVAPLDSHEVKLAAEQILPPPPPPPGFVVSVTRRGKFRRLHLVEACRLTPGVHYMDYEVWGDIMPGEGDVHAVCARCLAQGKPTAPQEPPDVISASSSSRGDEGSSAGEGAAKKPKLSGFGLVDAGPGAA